MDIKIKPTDQEACGLKILMVEDEAALVDMYHKYLRDRGFDFYSTPKVEEAIVIAKTTKIDIVLLDIVFPKEMAGGGINPFVEVGWKFLEEAKKDQKLKKIPVIVWTNLNNYKARAKAKRLGADRFVIKSEVMAKELIEIMKEVAGER